MEEDSSDYEIVVNEIYSDSRSTDSVDEDKYSRDEDLYEIDDEPHSVEISDSVDKYYVENDEKVKNFMAEKCCSDSCTDSFSVANVKTLHLNSSTLNYRTDGANVLDTVLLGIIQSMYQFRDPVHHARTVFEERQRGKIIYMINRKAVCRAFFLFSYGISLKRLKRLIKVYKEEGLVESKHGKCKVLPPRATSFETTTAVVQFIRNYS